MSWIGFVKSIDKRKFIAKKAFKNVKELEDLPNIGKSIAGDLKLLGIHKPEELRGKMRLFFNTLCSIMEKN
jgi:hypothetical protein